MSEEDDGARLEVRLDLLGEHLRCHLVGDEHRDELRALRRLGGRSDLEPGLLGLAARGASLAEADMHLDARVAEVERVRVALGPVADDRDLAAQQREVAVSEDRGHGSVLSLGELLVCALGVNVEI